MQYRFFHIPLGDDGRLAAEMNGFLRGQRIVSVARQWVSECGLPGWAFCVEYAPDKTPPAIGGEPGRPRIDYKEVLGEREFAEFARLRQIRRALAEADGVPPFVVFTDAQLAGLSRLAPLTLEGMKTVEGIGPGKLDRYGSRVLSALAAASAGPVAESIEGGGR